MSNQRIGRRKPEVQQDPELTRRQAEQEAAQEKAEQAAEAVETWKRDRIAESIKACPELAGLDPDDIDPSNVHTCPDTRNKSGYCAYETNEEWCIFCGEPEERK